MLCKCRPVMITAVISFLAINASAITKDEFTTPAMKYGPAPLYWLNDVVNNDTVDKHLANFKNRDGYGGITILPEAEWDGTAFLDKYGHLLKKLDSLGMWAVFCDDKSFPSGTAGGAIANFPQYCARQVYKTEKDVTGPTVYTAAVGQGTLMGYVAMSNTDHGNRIDISSGVSNGTLTWNVPAGSWKVMLFNCRRSNDYYKGIVDYLNPEAVAKWVSMSYQRFYDQFPSHFGTTIKSSFYDDVGYYQASYDRWGTQDHPCWTDSFNIRFKTKYGFSPVLYYPALWYDIGPTTSLARAILFGFRSELLATAWVKVIADWCAAHHIDGSGHPPNAYEVQSMEGAGDVMKFYQYAQRPLIDWIFDYGRGRNGFKLAGDAGCIYDHPIVQAECYGAVWTFVPDYLYRMAMDLFSRGINAMLPHAAWYKPGGTSYVLPELSYRNKDVAPVLPGYSKWVGRCQTILQSSRHVADIAVLYPINIIYADCTFGNETTSNDYQDISNRLTNVIRRDFTFVHPEVVDKKCTIDPVNRTLNLNNTINFEKYKVFIIPGKSSTGIINVSTLRKAKEFYDQGGIVICTGNLPRLSVEPGQDTAVINLATALFSLNPSNPGVAYKKNTNALGGAAYYIGNIGETVGGVSRLASVLDEAVPVGDVKFESPLSISSGGGSLNYIHKVKDNVDCYFFSNSSNDKIDTWVRLRGKIVPELWNPHEVGTGISRFSTPEYSPTTQGGQEITRVRLVLPAVSSVFIAATVNTSISHEPILKPSPAAPVFSRNAIHLNLENPGRLRASVMSLNGKKVAAWARQVKNAGQVVLSMPTAVFAPGLYLFTTELDGRQQLRVPVVLGR